MATDVYPFQHPVFRMWNEGTTLWNNETWRNLAMKDVTFSQVVMCIEIVFGGGKTVRVASSEVKTKSSSTGAEYFYLPILENEPEITSSISLMSPSSSSRSISISLSNRLVDAVSIIASGHALAGLAEISLQIDGMDYDSRLVLMRGTMDDGVSFDVQDGGMIQLTITDPSSVVDQTLPPYFIDTATFPNANIDSIGDRFPYIINKFPSVPCLLINYDGTDTSLATIAHALVCFGHNTTISSVVLDGDTMAVADWTASYGSDGDIRYTYITFTTPADIAIDAAIYANVVISDIYEDYGWKNKVAVPRAAIDAIYSLAFQHTSLGSSGLDHYAFGVAEATANKSMWACINAGGKSQATTIKYIEGEICSSFPMICMAFSGGGYGPYVIDRRYKTPRTQLTVGQFPVIERSSMVSESSKSQLYNNFTVKYNYEALDDVFLGAIKRTPLNSDFCMASMKMCGNRVMDELESFHIYDEETATDVVDWMATHLSLPYYTVEYTCFPSVMFDLYLGANIEITDPDFGWVDVQATIVKLSYQRGRVTMGLIVWNYFYSIGGSSRDSNSPDFSSSYTEPGKG